MCATNSYQQSKNEWSVYDKQYKVNKNDNQKSGKINKNLLKLLIYFAVSYLYELHPLNLQEQTTTTPIHYMHHFEMKSGRIRQNNKKAPSHIAWMWYAMSIYTLINWIEIDSHNIIIDYGHVTCKYIYLWAQENLFSIICSGPISRCICMHEHRVNRE